jgi:hypothetical protein
MFRKVYSLVSLLVLFVWALAACSAASSPGPLPVPTPSGQEDPSTASINGWVWAGGQPVGNVRIMLYQGDCPSSDPVATTTTTVASDLSYSFIGLKAGTYCVEIDPLEENNRAILNTGKWTQPAALEGSVSTTVTLAPGESKFDVNFAWEYAASELRPVSVTDVQIQVGFGSPIPVDAVVSGEWPDSCAQLAAADQRVNGNVIEITLLASPAEPDCTPDQTGLPLRLAIPLNVVDLPGGTYRVVVNGMSTDLTLPVASAIPSPAPTIVSNNQNQPCTDKAAFVADVSVPDNSILAPNAPFSKIWRLKNVGTCTWDNSYLVSYISGATMTQSPDYWIVERGQTVAPGQTVDISVGMTSPVESGYYQSFWGLRKEDGSFMPIQGGANGNSFYLKIKVNNAATVGKITAQAIDIVPEQARARHVPPTRRILSMPPLPPTGRQPPRTRSAPPPDIFLLAFSKHLMIANRLPM